jgi:hypothetical protein
MLKQIEFYISLSPEGRLGRGYFPYFFTNSLNKFHFSINHFQGITPLQLALKLGAQVESKTISQILVFL